MTGKQPARVVVVGGISNLEEENRAMVNITLSRDNPVIASDAAQVGFANVSLRQPWAFQIIEDAYFESTHTRSCHSARA